MVKIVKNILGKETNTSGVMSKVTSKVKSKKVSKDAKDIVDNIA